MLDLDWQSFWIGVLSSGGVLSVVGFVLKEAIKARLKHEFDKKLEKYKSEIQEKDFKREADKNLLANLLRDFPSSGNISFLRIHDFGGAFLGDDIAQLFLFSDKWNDAEHQFIDEVLEQQREALHVLVDKFLCLCGDNTWVALGNSEARRVPPEWRRENPERFSQVVTELNSLADQIVKAHQALTLDGRRKLGL